jgi:hypothetical protein
MDGMEGSKPPAMGLVAVGAGADAGAGAGAGAGTGAGAAVLGADDAAGGVTGTSTGEPTKNEGNNPRWVGAGTTGASVGVAVTGTSTGEPTKNEGNNPRWVGAGATGASVGVAFSSFPVVGTAAGSLGVPATDSGTGVGRMKLGKYEFKDGGGLAVPSSNALGSSSCDGADGELSAVVGGCIFVGSNAVFSFGNPRVAPGSAFPP